MLVRLRGVSESHVDALRSQSLVGICGFYGAFGLPGSGIQDWLSGRITALRGAATGPLLARP